MIPLNELKIGDVVYTPNPVMRHVYNTIQVLECKVVELPKIIGYKETCKIQPVDEESVYGNIKSTGRSLFKTAQECKDFYKNHYIIRDIVDET
jgi:hypothetical protein